MESSSQSNPNSGEEKTEFKWNEDPFIAEAQKHAIQEAAKNLFTRFDVNQYDEDERMFQVGWLQACYELNYLATGVENNWGDDLNA